MQYGAPWFPSAFPGPEEMAFDEVREYLEQASPENRKNFEDFIRWLSEDTVVQEALERNHSAKHFLYNIRKAVETAE